MGRGVPGPPNVVVVVARQLDYRNRLGKGVTVRSKSVLGGLHHEYCLAHIETGSGASDA